MAVGDQPTPLGRYSAADTDQLVLGCAPFFGGGGVKGRPVGHSQGLSNRHSTLRRVQQPPPSGLPQRCLSRDALGLAPRHAAGMRMCMSDGGGRLGYWRRPFQDPDGRGARTGGERPSTATNSWPRLLREGVSAPGAHRTCFWVHSRPGPCSTPSLLCPTLYPHQTIHKFLWPLELEMWTHNPQITSKRGR